jgi:hypothetical protein
VVADESDAIFLLDGELGQRRGADHPGSADEA